MGDLFIDFSEFNEKRQFLKRARSTGVAPFASAHALKEASQIFDTFIRM